MRFLSILLSIILLIPFAGCSKNPMGEDLESSSPESSEVSNKKDPSSIDFYSYEMTLVNPWLPLQEGFKADLTKIDSEFCPVELYFASVAVDMLHRMCRDAKAAGMNLTIISAYRTEEVQTSLFNSKVDRVRQADPSLTLEEAEKKAATAVARPGTSEHQLGLAVDFNTTEDSFKETREFQWLKEQCVYYGFILRYDEANTEKTGVMSEPWHFRYVGTQNAKMIKESGLCLEDFIEKYGNFQ